VGLVAQIYRGRIACAWRGGTPAVQ